MRSLLVAWFGLALGLAWWPPATLAQSLPTWLAGPSASGDSTLAGTVDSPPSGADLPTNRIVTLSGWVIDTAAPDWAGVDDVQVFLGSMDSGTLVSHPSFGMSRPDVAATLGNPSWSSAGWSGPLDAGALPAGQSTLWVYAHTPNKGWWYTQVTYSTGSTSAGPAPFLEVDAPRPDEKISDRLGYYRVRGLATDPAHGPSGIDYVEVWINGEQGSEAGKFLGVANLDAGGVWTLDFNPAQVAAITSNLYVYAHSGVTGKRTLVVVHVEIVDRPV